MKYQKESFKNPVKITSKRVKFLGIYLMKEVKYTYIENHNTLIKKTKYNLNKWKDSSCS